MSIGLDELRAAIAKAIEDNLYPPFVNMIDGEGDDPDYDLAAEAVIEVLKAHALIADGNGELP